MTDLWWVEAVYRSWWPSLTEDLQKGLTEAHDLRCFFQSQRSCSYKEEEAIMLIAYCPVLCELDSNVNSDFKPSYGTLQVTGGNATTVTGSNACTVVSLLNLKSGLFATTQNFLALDLFNTRITKCVN